MARVFIKTAIICWSNVSFICVSLGLCKMILIMTPERINAAVSEIRSKPIDIYFKDSTNSAEINEPEAYTLDKGRIVFDKNTRIKIALDFAKARGVSSKINPNLTDLSSDQWIRIWNLTTRERIPDSVAYVSRKHDVYVLDGLHNNGWLMFVNGNKIEFYYPAATHEERSKWVLDYFRRNPNINKKLMPQYIEGATSIYLKTRFPKETSKKHGNR